MLSKIRQWFCDRKEKRINRLREKLELLTKEHDSLKEEGVVIGNLVLFYPSRLVYSKLLYEICNLRVFCEDQSNKIRRELEKMTV